ncbi:endolytic transglycosylase MltG [Clostridium sp. 19966]|uniref:endolytic transglycosylase MltG n=1 Tax=Clostridium sp. 19966 TaxID=2768166 RepID=UPI0028DF89BF|nr:endolytic transglycosylase MltG [Clostridium sp. 19966]MDT8718128.1 endolytic transglycosylase MltG [Clostridium sp. 19966]
MKKLLRWIVCTWLVLTIIVVASMVYYKGVINHPLKISKQEKFTIKQGQSVSSVIDDLADKGKIKSALLLKLYIKTNSQNIVLNPGDFDINPNMNVAALVKSMSNSKDPNMVKITIPEGYTVEKIAEILDEKGIIKKNDFLQSCKSYALPSYISNNPNKKYALEGYLFPATYEFKKGSLGKNVIDKMIETFEANMKVIAKECNANISESDYEKLVTMASIVEGEIKADDERPIASSVFYNRLKINMKLESCATVEYAIGQHKDVLSESDYKFNSPFNTYKVSGLPAGPICSPGKASLMAAINPADTKYLYFVSKNDGTHEFNETFEAHNKAVQKYQSKNK